MAEPNEQAQAASDTADQTMAAGPTDVADSQTGANNPLSAYERELAAAMSPSTEPVQNDVQEQSGLENGEDSQDTGDDFAGGQDEESGSGEENPETGPDADDAVQSRRYRFSDPTDVAVAAIAKAKGISLMEAAKVFAGEQQAPQNVEHGDFAAPKQGEPQESKETAANVSQQIKQLIAEKKEKLSALEFDAAADIDAQIEELRDTRDELKVIEAQEKNRADQENYRQFEQKFASSEDLAIKYYPDSAVHDSPLAVRMKELDETAKELNDPLYLSPEKPFLLAQKAAKELGVLMTKPGVAAPAKKAGANNRPIQPASGNARTTAPAQSIHQFDQAVANIQDEASYDKMLAQLVG